MSLETTSKLITFLEREGGGVVSLTPEICRKVHDKVRLSSITEYFSNTLDPMRKPDGCVIYIQKFPHFLNLMPKKCCPHSSVSKSFVDYFLVAVHIDNVRNAELR